jgi:hypothetical protein
MISRYIVTFMLTELVLGHHRLTMGTEMVREMLVVFKELIARAPLPSWWKQRCSLKRWWFLRNWLSGHHCPDNGDGDGPWNVGGFLRIDCHGVIVLMMETEMFQEKLVVFKELIARPPLTWQWGQRWSLKRWFLTNWLPGHHCPDDGDRNGPWNVGGF